MKRLLLIVLLVLVAGCIRETPGIGEPGGITFVAPEDVLPPEPANNTVPPTPECNSSMDCFEGEMCVGGACNKAVCENLEKDVASLWAEINSTAKCESDDDCAVASKGGCAPSVCSSIGAEKLNEYNDKFDKHQKCTRFINLMVCPPMPLVACACENDVCVLD